MLFHHMRRPALASIEIQGKSEHHHLLSKANVLHRFIAKFLDLLIVSASSKLIPPIGFFIGLTYLLISDGLWQGQSIGKRIVGIYTIKVSIGEAGSFKESMLRNSTLAVGFMAGVVPYVGWIFLVAVIGVEALLIIGNKRGIRIGDELAQTQVIDHLPVPQAMT
jgi:uncharacterized RDD family membrane protein YckC